MKSKPRRIQNWIQWEPAPLIGVDEVGRGCLAGPVYAAAVILNTKFKYRHFQDSKILSVDRREILALEIHQNHLVGVGFATSQEIDEINILQASFLAMLRAIKHLAVQASRDLATWDLVLENLGTDAGPQFKCGHVIVDGHLRVKGLPESLTQTPVVKGDLRVAPVSAASIVAKVARDQFMTDLSRKFPNYGFESHKGYGTKEHQKALKQWGPCEFHRRSFQGVESPLFNSEEVE